MYVFEQEICPDHLVVSLVKKKKNGFFDDIGSIVFMI